MHWHPETQPTDIQLVASSSLPPCCSAPATQCQGLLHNLTQVRNCKDVTALCRPLYHPPTCYGQVARIKNDVHTCAKHHQHAQWRRLRVRTIFPERVKFLPAGLEGKCEDTFHLLSESSCSTCSSAASRTSARLMHHSRRGRDSSSSRVLTLHPVKKI